MTNKENEERTTVHGFGEGKPIDEQKPIPASEKH